MDLVVSPGLRICRGQRNGGGLDGSRGRPVDAEPIVIQIVFAGNGDDNLAEHHLRVPRGRGRPPGRGDRGNNLIIPFRGHAVPSKIPQQARAVGARIGSARCARIEGEIAGHGRPHSKRKSDVRGIQVGLHLDGDSTLRGCGIDHIRELDHVLFAIGIDLRRSDDRVSDHRDGARLDQAERFQHGTSRVGVSHINGVQEVGLIVVKVGQLEREFVVIAGDVVIDGVTAAWLGDAVGG